MEEKTRTESPRRAVGSLNGVNSGVGGVVRDPWAGQGHCGWSACPLGNAKVQDLSRYLTLPPGTSGISTGLCPFFYPIIDHLIAPTAHALRLFSIAYNFFVFFYPRRHLSR